MCAATALPPVERCDLAADDIAALGGNVFGGDYFLLAHQ
jgi:hypothetical protein